MLFTEVIEHVDRQQEVMREVKRIVRPGGALVVSTPTCRFPFLWDPENWIRLRLGRPPRHKTGCTNYTPEHRELEDFAALRRHLSGFSVERAIFSGRIFTPLLTRLWFPLFYLGALCRKTGFASGARMMDRVCRLMARIAMWEDRQMRAEPCLTMIVRAKKAQR